MRIVESGNMDRNKHLNRSLVLNTIHKYGPISKAKVAEKLELTFATIGNITSELTKTEAIRISGYGDSNGGRKPALYEINWDNFYVIAVDIGVTKVTAAIVNLKAEIFSRQHIVITNSQDSMTVIEKVYKAIDELLDQMEIPSSKIFGIGVSAPGPIDEDEGKILSPPNLQETADIKIKQLLEDRYNLITVLEKDANAAALAEQWFGSIQMKENILYILADQGIGGGIIIGTRIYRGFKNGAGELGHVSIDVDGPRCNCGNFGCLEAMASGIAIIKRVEQEIRRGVSSTLSDLYLQEENNLTLEVIIEHAERGDKLAATVLDEAGRYLGIGVANAINFFAPSKVIFGGQMIDLHPEIVKVAEEIAKSRSFSSFADNITYTKSSFGYQSTLIGAASIIQQKLFDAPQNTIIQR
ncbi:ROK family protein [Virgibacillus siamensis]|uniref:ROK family protein n=1 Tax=Virgibacillus siamensis TaxID=480071 RepID=UPI0009849494|nr:ROK family protein [Virgibacillus siamensis]